MPCDFGALSNRDKVYFLWEWSWSCDLLLANGMLESAVQTETQTVSIHRGQRLSESSCLDLEVHVLFHKEAVSIESLYSKMEILLKESPLRSS